MLAADQLQTNLGAEPEMRPRPNERYFPQVNCTLRIGLSVEDIKQSFLDNLFYVIDRVPAMATKNDLYTALAMPVRDRVCQHNSVRL
jgi:hypothetical protein